MCKIQEISDELGKGVLETRETEDINDDGIATQGLTAAKKRRGKGPLVEDEVRRSPRIQAVNNGFRKNPCPDNSCLPCIANPPKLSTKIVRNLASSFCKVADQELDAKLTKRAKKNDGGKDAREGKDKENKRKESEKDAKEKDAVKGKKAPAKKK